MSYTADDLAAIDKKIADGSRKVTYDGMTDERRSLKELKAIRAQILKDLTTQTDADKAYYPTFSKGY